MSKLKSRNITATAQNLNLVESEGHPCSAHWLLRSGTWWQKGWTHCRASALTSTSHKQQHIKSLKLFNNYVNKINELSPVVHAAALVLILFFKRATAALTSRLVMTFSRLVCDKRDASELTSLSRTGLGKASLLVRRSGLLMPSGLTCRGREDAL